MTYDLVIGDRSYSSWSLRGWLLFEKFGLPVNVRQVRMYTSAFSELLREYAPARTVPVMRLGEDVVTDSLAIAEELAQRHPEAGHWPEPSAARALARSMTAEMHSGFTALRGACPMSLRTAFSGVETGDEVRADLETGSKPSGDPPAIASAMAGHGCSEPIARRTLSSPRSRRGSPLTAFPSATSRPLTFRRI